MTANVETMAYAGELPWHGLGVKVAENLTPEEIMKEAGLDWTVSKRQLAYEGGTTGMAIEDRFALVRDTDDQFLDIVGKVYRPTQNKDAFDFFDKFVKEAKLHMHTAGSLCQGKFVWALAETKQHFEIGKDKDRVESYILLVSPHRFGMSLIAQQTTVRVVCQNTLNLALNEKGMTSYRMTHGREFNDRAKLEAAEVLGLATKSFNTFKDHVSTLAETKIKRVDAIEFYSELLKIKKEAANDVDESGLPKSRLLRQFMEAFEGGAPGANLSGTKDSLWGIINGVTYVLDHVSVRDPQKGLRDSWFGHRGDLKRKALNKALLIAA